MDHIPRMGRGDSEETLYLDTPTLQSHLSNWLDIYSQDEDLVYANDLLTWKSFFLDTQPAYDFNS